MPLEILLLIVLSTAGILGLPALYIYLDFKNKQRKVELIHKMVDENAELTPEIMELISDRKSPSWDRRLGIVLLSLGVGITFVFLINWGVRVSAIGLIPVMVGIAYLYLSTTRPEK